MMQHTPKQRSDLADNRPVYGDASVLVRNSASGLKVQSTRLCAVTGYSTYKDKNQFSLTSVNKHLNQA